MAAGSSMGGIHEAARADLSKLLWPGQPRSSKDNEGAIECLKRVILTDGLPEQANTSRTVSLRPLTWKLLLDVQQVSSEEYLDLVKLGPSAVQAKIRNDSFRTMATDADFQRRVKESMLVRLLDAFVWKHLAGESETAYILVQQ